MKSQTSPPNESPSIMPTNNKKVNKDKTESGILSNSQFCWNYEKKNSKRGTSSKGRKAPQKIFDLTLKEEDELCKKEKKICKTEACEIIHSPTLRDDCCHKIKVISKEEEIEFSSNILPPTNRYPQRNRSKPLKYWLGERYIYYKGKIIGLASIH